MAAEGKTTAAVTRKKVAAAVTTATQGAPEGNSGTADAAGATDSTDTAGPTDMNDMTIGDTATADLQGSTDSADTAGATDVITAGTLGDTAGMQVASAPALLPPTVIEAPEFPRLVQIVNDTPIPYVVARHHVEPHGSKPVPVNDDDELARMRFECASILSISDHYKDSEPPMLRVAEVE